MEMIFLTTNSSSSNNIKSNKFLLEHHLIVKLSEQLPQLTSRELEKISINQKFKKKAKTRKNRFNDFSLFIFTLRRFHSTAAVKIF